MSYMEIVYFYSSNFYCWICTYRRSEKDLEDIEKNKKEEDNDDEKLFLMSIFLIWLNKKT